MDDFWKPDHLDVVLIAAKRPRILEVTLGSFKAGFLGRVPNVRLIANIDPIGNDEYSQEYMVDLIRDYFPNVVYRTPETPSFSDAVQWCWQQVASEIFLHLEDDWCLKKRVDPESIGRYFSQDVAGVRLNLKKNPKTADPNEIVPNPRMSLNPSFFRTRFIQDMLPFFDTSKDPEKQFGGLTEEDGELYRRFSKWEFVYYGKPGERAYVIDTGKKWRKYHSLVKWDPKSQNITWKKRPRRSVSLKGLLAYGKFMMFLSFWRWKYL